MKSYADYNALINQIIQPLKDNKICLKGEIFRYLFLLSFDDLKAAELGNPLIHHLVVLQHVITIAQAEYLNLLQAGAIAILHDIAPVEKIRKADLKIDNSEKDKKSFEAKRWQHRVLHMREGSALARKKIILLNKYLGKNLYTDKDIEIICNVISIHDNPSIDIPITRDNRMAVAFREADRLWMLSEEGFNCDLQRDMEKISKVSDNEALASNRLKHIIKRFQEERELYDSNDESFQNDRLFFRTKSGYQIYLNYLQERKKQYSIGEYYA